MARPRKLRDEEIETQVTAEEEGIVKTAENGEKMYKIGGRLGYIKPYTSRTELEKGKYSLKTMKDGKTYFSKIENGEARFKIVACSNGVFKIISIFSNSRGKSERLAGLLKTKRKDERGRHDKMLIDKLRKAGFPGL